METELAQLFGKTPKEWITDGTSLMLIAMILGRAWHAITTNGGLSGVWKGLIFGVNAPKPESKNENAK